MTPAPPISPPISPIIVGAHGGGPVPMWFAVGFPIILISVIVITSVVLWWVLKSALADRGERGQ